MPADEPENGDDESAHGRGDRRQLADQGQAAPVGAGPDRRARGDEHHIAALDRGRLARGHRPRQRPAGRVHPAPLGARRARAPRGAARRLRRRHAGRDRLRAPADARATTSRRLGLDRQAVTVVTQVEVDRGRPRLRSSPSKPIGVVHGRGRGGQRRDARGLDVVEDAGRGWRRVVASPQPDAHRRAAGRPGAARGRLRRDHRRRRRHPGRRRRARATSTASPP